MSIFILNMTTDTNDNPLYWLTRLGTAVEQHRKELTSATRAAMLAEMYTFKAQVDGGLKVPKYLPEPTTRSSRTYSDWMELQVDEAKLMFGISPTEQRMEGLVQILDRYADDVAKGRVKR